MSNSINLFYRLPKRWIKKAIQLPYKLRLGFCGKDNDIHYPCHIGKPSNVFLYDYTLIQPNCRFIIHTAKVYIKKWSSLSSDCIVVTGNHKPTVGVCQRLLGRYHINDTEKDVIIEEDCWVGARVTILGGTHLNRGCVVGANSLLNKEYPPYAVLVGSPAKVIASKFTLEQIIKHEKMLYPESERLSREYLESIFTSFYSDKKSIGIDCISENDLAIIAEHSYMQFDIPKKK